MAGKETCAHGAGRRPIRYSGPSLRTVRSASSRSASSANSRASALLSAPVVRVRRARSNSSARSRLALAWSTDRWSTSRAARLGSIQPEAGQTVLPPQRAASSLASFLATIASSTADSASSIATYA
jgi:hypothetical protein